MSRKIRHRFTDEFKQLLLTFTMQEENEASLSKNMI